MTAFATLSDVTTLTGATYTTAQQATLTALLASATSHLQDDVIGCRVVCPTETVTVSLTVGVGEQWVPLPSSPVRSVTTVSTGGVNVDDWELHDGKLYRRLGWWDGTVYNPPTMYRDFARILVTYVHGFDVLPDDLKSWCRALALQAFTSLSELGTLGSGNVQSVRIDDYSKAYAAPGAGGASAGFVVPTQVADKLKARYGGGAQLVKA